VNRNDLVQKFKSQVRLNAPERREEENPIVTEVICTGEAWRVAQQQEKSFVTTIRTKTY